MGGHAFHLFTPRIPRSLYLQTKTYVTEVLQTLFAHVCVPLEMPSKIDFGDIDFLVAGPLTRNPAFKPTSTTEFDYAHHVSMIKTVLNTDHGRKGIKAEKVMFFAIPAPGNENKSWIQIDLKVCEEPSQFEWERFSLNYATASKLIGSMLKPLGLTLDQEGLSIRVEGLEETNWEKSLVFLTNDPKDVLKIVGLDKRLLTGGFKENNELFNYITGSWLFNPAHFAERLKDKKYEKQLSDRAPSHVPFVKAWISEQFPNYELSGPDVADKLTHWYSTTRAVVRDRVLAMYPYVAQRYYVNRGDYFREIEENRLRELIKASITVGLDGWNGDLPEPSIIVKCATQQNQIRGIEPHKMSLLITGPLKPPPSPTITAYTKIGMKESLGTPESSSSDLSLISEATIWSDMEKTPLTLEELPRSPPREYVLRPPPEGMPVNAKLLCLARWTRFDASGNPYISSEPREKNFAMDWASSGAEDVALVRWAKYMWWHIWVRQHRVNYVGMWKKRFEEEDRKAEKNRWGELADGFKEIHDACEKCASVLEGAGNRGLRA